MKATKNGRGLTLREAAERLAKLVEEKHLSTLSESERKTGSEAFHRVVSRICASTSKSPRPRRAVPGRALSRKRVKIPA